LGSTLGSVLGTVFGLKVGSVLISSVLALATNSRSCSIATGAASSRAMITRAPSLVARHSNWANSVGSRTQPCDAG
jgi:hypothetical protein